MRVRVLDFADRVDAAQFVFDEFWPSPLAAGANDQARTVTERPNLQLITPIPLTCFRIFIYLI